jgi:hypothetical protein
VCVEDGEWSSVLDVGGGRLKFISDVHVLLHELDVVVADMVHSYLVH